MKILVLLPLILIITVILFINRPNDSDATVMAPLHAYAGKDQRVPEHSDVTLFGSGKDPLKKELSYHWRQTSGEKVELSAADIAKPSFFAPEVANGETKTLTFEIIVSDDIGRDARDTITVIVDPVNNSPSKDIKQNRTPNVEDSQINIFPKSQPVALSMPSPNELGKDWSYKAPVGSLVLLNPFGKLLDDGTFYTITDVHVHGYKYKNGKFSEYVSVGLAKIKPETITKFEIPSINEAAYDASNLSPWTKTNFELDKDIDNYCEGVYQEYNNKFMMQQIICKKNDHLLSIISQKKISEIQKIARLVLQKI